MSGPVWSPLRIVYSHVRSRSETGARLLRVAGLLRVLLSVSILFALSNRRWRALLRRVRFHLLFMEDGISPLLYGGRANPTQKC